MTTINKGKTVDTSNLQPVELIYTDLAFYNITSIRGFTFMITVVCAKTRMIWVLPIVSKRTSVSIIQFILTTIMNEQNPYEHVGVY